MGGGHSMIKNQDEMNMKMVRHWIAKDFTLRNVTMNTSSFGGTKIPWEPDVVSP